MPVLTLHLEEVNFLAGPAASYALVDVAGELLFIDTRCPHRGGPLHLGRVEADARGRPGLRCPWHQTLVPLTQLRKLALPMVWNRHTGQAAVVVEANADLMPMLRHPHATRDPRSILSRPAAPCLGALPTAAPLPLVPEPHP